MRAGGQFTHLLGLIGDTGLGLKKVNSNMAAFIKRGESQWQAKIRRKGFAPQSKTFNTKPEAEKWARSVEAEIDRGTFIDRREADGTTLEDALERYGREVTPLKKGARAERNRIKRWQAHKLAKCSLSAVRGKDMAKFRDERRAEGKAENTIRLDLALISAMYETARREWGLEGLANPVRMIKAPGSSNRRDRCLSALEEPWLFAGMEAAMPRTPNAKAILQLAIATGMRQGEILKIEWSDVKLSARHIHLSDTKSGDPRDVPLSPQAIDIVQSLPRPLDGGKVFDVSQDRLIRAFSQACKLGRKLYEAENAKQPPEGFLSGLVFHSLRHTAATRMAPLLSAHELCRAFGWKTMQMALRYYHPTGESLADKLAVAAC